MALFSSRTNVQNISNITNSSTYTINQGVGSDVVTAGFSAVIAALKGKDQPNQPDVTKPLYRPEYGAFDANYPTPTVQGLNTGYLLIIGLGVLSWIIFKTR